MSLCASASARSLPAAATSSFPAAEAFAGAPRRSGVSSRSTNTSRVSDGSETTSTADVTRRGGSRERFSTMASFPSSFRSTSFGRRASVVRRRNRRPGVRAPRSARLGVTGYRVRRRFGSRRVASGRVRHVRERRERQHGGFPRRLAPAPERLGVVRAFLLRKEKRRIVDARRRALARRIRPEPERRRARRDVHRAHASVLAERVGVRQRVLRLEKRLTSAPDRLAGSYRLLAFTRPRKKSASRSASVKKLGAPEFWSGDAGNPKSNTRALRSAKVSPSAPATARFRARRRLRDQRRRGGRGGASI